MIERIFKAYDIRATYPDMINEDCAWKVGYATALYSQRSRQSGFGPKVRMEKTIVVGRDMRAHSPALQAALMDGVRAAGFDALDAGMVDTPLIYFAINNLDCVAGIQVSSRHGPRRHPADHRHAARRQDGAEWLAAAGGPLERVSAACTALPEPQAQDPRGRGWLQRYGRLDDPRGLRQDPPTRNRTDSLRHRWHIRS
jgi:hypothetical protein